MDPVTAVGLAASLVSLLQAAHVLLQIITTHPQRLCQGSCGDPFGNAHLRQRLEDTLNDFIHTLQSAGSVSPSASAYTLTELQKLKTMLESLEVSTCQRCPSFIKCIWSCVRGPNVYAKLEEAERRLQNLRTEVIVREGALILLNQLPRICNEIVEIPESDVGLDRVRITVEFLQHSQQQELRVIGIHGLPGLGKTTTLNKIWEEASSKSPFAARAFVQIGLDPTPGTLCKLQSSILEQLDGGKQDFPTEDFGRGKLNEHFLKLRSSNKPLFLALDNVWEAEDLQKLLPSRIWADLPRFSCIALTSRNFRVVKALSNICHLQEGNDSQVLFYSPPYLSPEDSKALFVDSASILRAIEHEELLQALVPLCGGLPLALVTLGSIFKDEANREEEQWRGLVEEMKGHIDPGEFTPVKKALELSYEQLQPTHKAAFLDVVHFYYGWPWERVERIVGGHVLHDLKNRSLISEAQDITRCNRSAVRYGHYGGPLTGDLGVVVAMHDLTLRFGSSLHKEAIIRSDDNLVVNVEDFVSLGEASKWRTLKLRISQKSNIPTKTLEFLRRATNLKMLYIEISEDDDFYLEAGNEYFGASASACRPCQLRYLRIGHSYLSRRSAMELVGNLIIQWMRSRELREIYLGSCKDIVQLTDFSFEHLERLAISRCDHFQSFSKRVETWLNLQVLEVRECKSITEVPAQLVGLPNLRRLIFEDCPSLERFASVECNPSWKCLQELSFFRCPKLQQLPTSICNATSLRALFFTVFSSTNSRILIPDDIWNLQSLETVWLDGCSVIERLPDSICDISSLRSLRISSCESIGELPERLGSLTSLTELDASRCTKLERLPDSICDIPSLQSLRISFCESIVELPERLGSLTSLTKLNATCCTKLERLPDSICDIPSLQSLCISSCESIAELPERLGSLTSLTELDASHCTKLERLPDSICDIPSLWRLRISSCESMVELPERLGSLTSLRELDASRCTKLERLPDSICDIPSLQSLCISSCGSIAELPERVGSLTSLTLLDARRCTKLERLPDSICDIPSLQCLCISSCESIVELPERLGSLTSLTKVDASHCTKSNGAGACRIE